jgi:hypothetical protein
MNGARQQVWKLVLMLATSACAQNSQFLFDDNGNLTAQMAAPTAPPRILGQPQNQIVAPGGAASFSVVAANTKGLSYQWRFNGANLVFGANSDTLLRENVRTNHEGEYQVVLINPSGSVTSAPARLWLDSDADGMGDSFESGFFTNLNQNATADFDGDSVSNQQEFVDGTDPTDRSSARFRLLVMRDGGSVIKMPDQPSYTNGETVVLTAIDSAQGEPFHAWLGGIVTRSNPVTVVITSNLTVRARFTPVVFTWTNPAAGDWNSPANWMPNLAPGSNDSVIISTAAAVTLNTPADCADITLGGAGSSPALTGSGTLTVRGNFQWTSGIMSGSGRTVLETGATLALDNATSLSLNSRTLELGGTARWTGVEGMTLNNAVITNRAGAVFDALHPNPFTTFGGSSRFDNAGTFRKLAGGGTMSFATGVAFNNHGTVEIQTGALALGGGGLHSGSYVVPSGTALILSGGTHTAGGGSIFAGAGQFTVSGGTANLAGLVNVSGSNTFSGGTANLTGHYICTNNVLTISAGTANFGGTGVVEPAMVTLSNGSLGGNNVVTVRSAMDWTGGAMSGSGRTIIPTGVTLNIANPGVTSLTSRTLENGGTILLTGAGGISMSSGAVITNRAGALFHVQNVATWNGVGANRVENAGTFRVSVNPGATLASGGIAFNNHGTVDIQTGGLELSGGGTHSGIFTVPAGTRLALSGTHTAGGASSITGAGQFAVSGGTVTLAGLINVTGTNTFSGAAASVTGLYICTNNTLNIFDGTVNFDGTGVVAPATVTLRDGTLGGSGVVTVRNAMDWTSGAMSGTGRTIIPAGARLNAAVPSAVSLTGRTLENGGTLLWTGAGNFGMNSGAVITNRAGALFHVQNAASFVGFSGSRIDNAGTFRKSSNTEPTTLTSGVGFNNYNTVEIMGGILAANGGYTSSSGALLHCALGGTAPGTGHGQLQVAGTVNLNGSLGVELINGFVPAEGHPFTVLTAGTRNGMFARFLFPSNAVTMQMSNTATAVIVRASEVLVVPQPAFLPPELFGTDIRLTWAALSNRTYRLEFSPNLDPSNWTALPGDVTSTSNRASKLDALTSSNRFYRIRTLP